MDLDSGQKKRKRLVNQITSGLVVPSSQSQVKSVKLINGGATWHCNSSSTSAKRTVSLVNGNNNKTYFTCDCGGESIERVQCKHIINVLVKLCIDQADIAGSNEDHKHKLMDLLDCFGDMKIEKDKVPNIHINSHKEVHMDNPLYLKTYMSSPPSHPSHHSHQLDYISSEFITHIVPTKNSSDDLNNNIIEMS